MALKMRTRSPKLNQIPPTHQIMNQYMHNCSRNLLTGSRDRSYPNTDATGILTKTIMARSPWDNHLGPGCSKLTTSLVNVSLNFLKLISQICQYFLLKKCEKLLHCKSFSHFFNKNISGFSYKVVKHLTS